MCHPESKLLKRHILEHPGETNSDQNRPHGYSFDKWCATVGDRDLGHACLGGTGR
jgi:hypothetical protein